jgi:SAM-dependent methyltransferase
MNVKYQEYKFVEWSRGVSNETWDIRRIISWLLARDAKHLTVADIGGGVGRVASVIAEAVPTVKVDVIDSSHLAAQSFIHHERTNLICGDFLGTETKLRYDAVIFRTVLHHIVSRTDAATSQLQLKAIRKASEMLLPGGAIFVTENIYDSFFLEDGTGRIIYEMMCAKRLAPVFRRFGANTAGEGVRFRSLRAWSKFFDDAGLSIDGEIFTERRDMPLWQRIPLLCEKHYQVLVTLKQQPRASR